jgi:hypothetical protein
MRRILVILFTGCAVPVMDSAEPFAPRIFPIDTNPRFTAWGYRYDATQWTYRADLGFQPDTVHLFITQDTVSPWDEDWDLEWRPLWGEGEWYRWEIVLPIIDIWGMHGPATLFGNPISCENPWCETTMAWRLEAKLADVRTDCAIWAGSAADVAIVRDDGCREVAPEWLAP